jgi:plasmid stability protein
MATLTIRNVGEKTHRALRLRAAEHGRSVEEEVRRILAERADEIPAHRNSRSPEEIAAAVDSLQNLFAPLRGRYSVDQFLAEKREEAARERAVEETWK